MSAYVIVDVNVTDPQGFENYKEMSPAAVAAYGGKYLARAGRTEILEGDWNPTRLVVLEFESVERAKEWLESEEYRQARALRHQYAETNMVVIEGT
ncbi:MAG: DUF1330 domain-containing protein [Chloroflexota bacterium]|jgi:uncharacterized protein (DUF1330 family)